MLFKTYSILESGTYQITLKTLQQDSRRMDGYYFKGYNTNKITYATHINTKNCMINNKS